MFSLAHYPCSSILSVESAVRASRASEFFIESHMQTVHYCFMTVSCGSFLFTSTWKTLCIYFCWENFSLPYLEIEKGTSSLFSILKITLSLRKSYPLTSQLCMATGLHACLPTKIPNINTMAKGKHVIPSYLLISSPNLSNRSYGVYRFSFGK